MRCIRVRQRFRRQKISFVAVVIMCNEPVSLIKIKDIKFAPERFYAVYFSVLTASGKSSNKIRALDAAPDKDFAPGTFHVRTSFEVSLVPQGLIFTSRNCFLSNHRRLRQCLLLYITAIRSHCCLTQAAPSWIYWSRLKKDAVMEIQIECWT